MVGGGGEEVEVEDDGRDGGGGFIGVEHQVAGEEDAVGEAGGGEIEVEDFAIADFGSGGIENNSCYIT